MSQIQKSQPESKPAYGFLAELSAFLFALGIIAVLLALSFLPAGKNVKFTHAECQDLGIAGACFIALAAYIKPRS